jgi:hypothetical protein
MNDVKLCKNCKHFRRDNILWWQLDFAKCKAPQNEKKDLISGKITYRVKYCESQRSVSDDPFSCSASGQWFEAKNNGGFNENQFF